ncbi:MAG: MbnP family protein [Bacteroidota bacterium]
MMPHPTIAHRIGAILLGWLICAQVLHAGGGEMTIRLVWQGQPVVLEKPYPTASGADTIVFSKIRCYVSDLRVYSRGQCLTATASAPCLLDAKNGSIHPIPLEMPAEAQVDEIRFTLGLDSTVNVSGAYGGDLDPTTGMYWAWQSGYINCKLEGRATAIPTQDHQFQFHLGGYRSPYLSAVPVQLAVSPGAPLVVDIPLDAFFSAVNLQADYRIMRPGAKAHEMSQLLGATLKSVRP